MFSLSFLVGDQVVTVVADVNSTNLLRALLNDRAVQVRHVGTGNEVQFDEDGYCIPS